MSGMDDLEGFLGAVTQTRQSVSKAIENGTQLPEVVLVLETVLKAELPKEVRATLQELLEQARASGAWS